MANINSTPSPVRYPYLYAENIVDKFIDSYSRVCIFVAKKSGIDPKRFRMLLIAAFMYRNKRWNIVRDMLKYIHRRELYDEMSFFDPPDFRKYLTHLKYFIEEELIDAGKLDERIDVTEKNWNS
jgi:hypothetical protein